VLVIVLAILLPILELNPLVRQSATVASGNQ
jgi:hypothetical protein